MPTVTFLLLAVAVIWIFYSMNYKHTKKEDKQTRKDKVLQKEANSKESFLVNIILKIKRGMKQ